MNSRLSFHSFLLNFYQQETERKIQSFQRFEARGLIIPFLFTMVVDVLARFIDKAKECNVVQGFIVGRDRVEVSHLQFADDTLLFMEADHTYFLNLLKILKVFHSFSGLRVNLSKSALLGINTGRSTSRFS